MSKIKLVAMDLDNTLLDSEKQISKHTEEVLKEAIRRGVYIVPATGRIFKAIPEFLRNIPGVRYAVCCNGATVYDQKEDKIIYTNHLPKETVFSLFDILEKYHCTRDIYQNGQGYMERCYFDHLAEYGVSDHVLKLVRDTRLPLDDLRKYIEEHPNFIQPESRKNEMLNNFIKPGLQDLCVSRTSFDWGIPVDIDPKHVVYVWLDALTNYITNIGYDPDGSSSEFNKWWPADLHLIGKDIIRFHTIYWPCFLWSLDLELPKQVFGHPWLLTNNDKIGKSRGNAIYADDLVDLFGVDAVRYYVLHEIPFANDGNLTYELLIERTNTDLANTLGNLVNRTISMANKYFDGQVTNKKVCDDLDKELIDMVNALDGKVEKRMEKLEIGFALDEIFEVLRRSNKYIDETMPWSLAKKEDKKDRLETVLYNLLESIRVCANHLTPFLTNTSKEILKQLNTTDTSLEFKENSSYNNMKPEVLFQRIDKEKKIKEIEENN